MGMSEQRLFEMRYAFVSGGSAVVSRTGSGFIRIAYYGGGRLTPDPVTLSVADIRALAKFADETDAALRSQP